MKMRIRSVAIFASVILSASFAICGLTGCSDHDDRYNSERFNALANAMALTLMGNDTFGWNVFSVSPETSYGYQAYGDPQFYSYQPISLMDVANNLSFLGAYNKELAKFDPASLNSNDAITYRKMKNVIDTYTEYYSSQYVFDFELIGGGYISSMGGYVAEFTTVCDNYKFRNENDVKNLLSVTISTKDAFATYLDYAENRVKADYPLYDYTITAMQDYLAEIIDLGDSYYMYELFHHKLDGASFLTSEQKEYYKTEYDRALTDYYMEGVKALSSGLDDYKGYVSDDELKVGYLGAYGEVGEAYYKWKFGSITGLKNVDLVSLYNELVGAFALYSQALGAVNAEAAELENTDSAAYAEYVAYMENEKALFDLSSPQEMLEYLKTAAKKIVPALQTEPNIAIEYMDETVGKISNTTAYYLRSPLDEIDSVEKITINPYAYGVNIDSSDLLVLMAHEGYPGHLYAHVNAKEQGVGLMSAVSDCLSFSEGWAKYVELALLDNIAEESENKAIELYCNNKKYYTLYGYIMMAIYDLDVNYFGASVDDFMSNGSDEDSARSMITQFMEIPTIYIPYGYGMYEMVKLHDTVKAAFGELYDEVEYNGILLSEGSSSTLPRAREMTSEYISDRLGMSCVF